MPTHSSMQIRLLQASDAAVFQQLRLRALQDHADAFTSSFEEVLQQPLDAAQKRLSSTGTEKVWGAFEGGVLVGMVGLNQETRRNNRHKAVLVSMVVTREFSRRGIGSALVAAALENATKLGVELVVLTVTDGNHAAQALYENAGFLTFGVEPDAIRVAGGSYGKRHMYLQLAPRPPLATAAAFPAFAQL